MTKKFFTLLIFFLFFIAVALTSSCSAPIGGLLHGGAALDYIKAAPSRFLYRKSDRFWPADPERPLKVFGIFGGVEKPIDIDKVTIKIIQDLGFISETEFPIPDNLLGLLLDQEGMEDGLKTVVISYGGMETSYSIFLGDVSDIDPPIGNSGTEMIMKWE